MVDLDRIWFHESLVVGAGGFEPPFNEVWLFARVADNTGQLVAA